MIPTPYAYLNARREPLLVQMAKLYGTQETPGAGDNAVILGWAKEVGVDDVYKHDEIPWCGLCVAVSVKRAGQTPVDTPLWAKAWARFGNVVKPGDEGLGDVLIFVRDGGGHVGLYAGEDKEAFHVLGGNQRDQVNITRIDKLRLYAARRGADFGGGTDIAPKIFLAPDGSLSKNEA